MSSFFGKITGALDSAYSAAKETAGNAYNASKNYANTKYIEASKKMNPPPTTPQFELNGQLCPDEFIAAGDKLTEVCSGWKWKPSSNPKFQSEYLPSKKQYLLLEDVHCYRRIRDIEQGKSEQKMCEDGESIIVLHAHENAAEQVAKKEDYRNYKMYIVYEEHYHTPKMYFSATDCEGRPVSNEHIKQDIQKEYLGATLTFEQFPFIENCQMAMVHPCKHAAVLKTMADAMRENGQRVQAHNALFIFLKFITSVIPTVEFDLTGTLSLE